MRKRDGTRPGVGRRGLAATASVIAMAACIWCAPAAAQQRPPRDQSPEEASSAPPVAATQSSPSDPAAPTDQGNAQSATSDIIVTAQKREERLKDVPIAISVINNQLLASTNSRNFAELQGTIPSVYFAGNSGGGRTYITMRGATGLALNTGDEPVAVYADDVYLARGVTVGMADLLDIGTIEIVRGPQGTLQGRNATAGAILIRSADPTSDLQGRVSAGISDPLEFRAQAALSGPIGDTGLKFRIAGGYVNDRGWSYNPYRRRHEGGAKSYQGRAVLTYGEGALSGRFVVDYSNIRNQPAIFRYASTTFSTTPGALVKTPTPNTPLPQATRDAIFKDNRISLNPGSDTFVETGGVSSKLTYTLDGVDLVSVTGLRRAIVKATNDSDGLDTAQQGFNRIRDASNSFSQELRLQSTGRNLIDWIVGFYFFNEHQDFDDNIFNLKLTIPTNTVTRYYGIQNTYSYASFADATINIAPTLQVIGGIRYTNDRKRFNAYILPRNLDTNVRTVTRYVPKDAKYDDVSYRAKLVWHPTPDIMLYGGYGKGFRAGGFNPFLVQAPYAPETLKSYEIGSKGDLFERALSFSVSAYTNDYANLQLRGGVPAGGAIITNAGRSRIKGVEAELTLRPAEGTRVTANGAYTDAKFTSFPLAFNSLNQPVNATGNFLPRTPKYQYFVSAEQDFDLSDAFVVTAEANYRWRDRIYFLFTDQTAPTWQDGPGGELGARISVHTPDGRRSLSLSLFATNLTNQRIINTAAVTFSYPQVGLNKPRVIGVSGEARF